NAPDDDAGPESVAVAVPGIVVVVGVVVAARRALGGAARREQATGEECRGAERALHRSPPGVTQLTMPITPPFGSAMTARLPPSRSGLGATTTRPPELTVRASAAGTSSTRM